MRRWARASSVALVVALAAGIAGDQRIDERAGVPGGARPGADVGHDAGHRDTAPGTTTSTGPGRDGAPEGAGPARSARRTFTLVATGDVLLHAPLWEQARADAVARGESRFDFRPMLAGVRPEVEAADVAICHLETPLAPAGGPYAGYPAFSVPPEIAPALADTGYDACTTASNHTFDRGADGIDRTLDALDAAGIRHAGSARTPAEAGRITMLRAGGALVALLSYTYGFNGVPAPGGQAWRANPIDLARILGDAHRARAAGADVVVVALHWGQEYDQEPTAQQLDLAPRLIRSPDVDLLLGHHAHVVEPVEAVDGEWVVYGLGNLVARHATPGAPNAEGLLVRVTFSEDAAGRWRATAARYAPLLMVTDRPPLRVLDVDRALADPATVADPVRRARLELARDRTAAVVASRGATAAGLRPIGATG